MSELTADHFPALFRGADKASVVAQRKYMWLFGSTLILLILGAILAAVRGEFLNTTAPAILSAVLLSLSLLLTIALKSYRFEQVWYGSRAIAESVKTLSWRYMTGADPYPISLLPVAADRRLRTDLAAVLKQRHQLAFALGGEESAAPQISEKMRGIRSMPLAERKSIYLTERILDQKNWYSNKARNSRRSEGICFILIMVAQGFACLFSILLVRSPNPKLNLAGFFCALASALIAWLQLKQYQELAQSYSVAALELGLIEDEAQCVSTEVELSSFVSDAEKAISREHTLWVARRDKS